MESLGFVFAIINVLVASALGIIAKVTDRLPDAKSAVKKGLKLAYLQFGNTTAAALPESYEPGIADFSFEGLDLVAKEMGRWHYSSVEDLIKIKRIEWIMHKMWLLMFIAAILSVILVAACKYSLNESQLKLKLFLIIGAPVLLLVCELGFLRWFLKSLGYLKTVINKYENLE